MRYVIAMIFALAVALFTAAQFAAPVTNSVLDGMKFESPDQVEVLYSALMASVAFIGLLIGWVIGWAVGGLFVRSDSPTAQPPKG